MNEYEISEEQKREYIIQALTMSGFEEITDNIYACSAGDRRVGVDLSAGVSIYFVEGTNRIDDDDETGTLKKVADIITDAMCGTMPTKTQPDMHYTDQQIDELTAKPPTCGICTAPTPQQELVKSTAPPAKFIPQGTMIKNLTPMLKEIGKIKIGRKGAMKTTTTGKEFRLPEKFDHFEVVTLHKDDNGDFIPDTYIMDMIGHDAKELDVSLLYNDPTLNFYTCYAQYKGGKCLCRGDGQIAVDVDGVRSDCDPDTCMVFKTKKCKPNGILSVILKQSPRLGGVYKFRTTSYNSIRSILSSMFFIQSLTGGVLANIPLKMTIAPQSVNPIGSPTAQTIYVVNLEYPGTIDDLHKQVIEIMTTQSNMQHKIHELEAQAKQAVCAIESQEEIHDIESEFYPDNMKDGIK